MHVFLDLDGTLCDSGEGIAASLGHALVSLGRPAPPAERVAECIGPPLPQVFERLLPDADAATRERAVALYREHYSAHGWAANRVYPGALALLETLRHSGWRAAIATSKSQRGAERIADHFGLRPHLTGVYGVLPDGSLAAKREVLAHALRSEGARPERSAMVGDRLHDVEAARALGVHPIGVAWGYAGPGELEAAGAARVCDTPEAVLRALREFARTAAAS